MQREPETTNASFGEARERELIQENTHLQGKLRVLVLEAKNAKLRGLVAAAESEVIPRDKRDKVVGSLSVAATIDSSSQVKQEGGECNEDEVLDVTEEAKLLKELNKPEVEIVDLIRDDDVDDGDNDDDEYESDDQAHSEDHSSSTSTADSLSDKDYAPEGPTTKPRPDRKRRRVTVEQNESLPIIEVLIEDRDLPAAPGCHDDPCNQGTGFISQPTLAGESGTTTCQSELKAKIVKMLNIGLGKGSTEAEAQQAMKLARRLMTKNNLKQVEILREQDESIKTDEGALKGGLVTVETVNRRTRVPLARCPRYLRDLSTTVAKNFDVAVFSQSWPGRKAVGRKLARPPRYTFTFYGIYSSCQVAAYAYKVATEKLVLMIEAYQPQKRNRTNQPAYTRKARTSYGLGVVDGLETAVNDSKRRELERRRAKLNRAKSALSKGEAYEESEDDDDNDDDGDDGDDDGEHGANAVTGESKSVSRGTTSNISAGRDHSDSNSPWGKGSGEKEVEPSKTAKGVNSRCSAVATVAKIEYESNAQLALVDYNKKVAASVLETNHIDLAKGRKMPVYEALYSSFVRGQEDAKEIDLDQRAIKGRVGNVKMEKTEGLDITEA